MKSKHPRLYEDTKIFVVCPAGIKTGGTEVIHQLVNILQAYVESYVYYINLKKPIVAEEFISYKCKYKLHLEKKFDYEHNILIVPETHTNYLFMFEKIQKVLWWLSVDNYTAYLEKNNGLKRIEYMLRMQRTGEYFTFFSHKKQVFHLAQSEYAKEFLRNNGVKKVFYLSDYINDIYIEEKEEKERRNVVLFNPRKGYEFTKQIIERMPEVDFVPIVNMTNEEIVALMMQSKVYIDFGYHPGKDRLPREAAVSGLCIITGKNGAAGNNVDINIPDKYKYEANSNNIAQIKRCIEKCLSDYKNVICDFECYREKIKKEKREFELCVKKIFWYEDK